MIPEPDTSPSSLALVLSLVQAVVPLVGAHRNNSALMAVGRPPRRGSSSSSCSATSA